MKTTHGGFSLLIAAAILTLAFGWKADAGRQGYPREETLYLSGGESTDPREYDPATTRSSGDKMAFSGLFSFSPQLELANDLVESYTVRDGTVFTFVLRANAHFHDGRAVTAQDVAYSWERAANPATDSDTVLTYLGDIVGVKEMKAGQADHISGLRVVDDRTLEVTIDQPKPYFLAKLTYPTAFVVDRANVESGADWYRRPNGTGPYRLTSWTSMEEMVYERNDDFYLGAPAIRYIVIRLYSGVPIRLYESGEIDIGSVYWYDVPRVSDPENPLFCRIDRRSRFVHDVHGVRQHQAAVRRHQGPPGVQPGFRPAAVREYRLRRGGAAGHRALPARECPAGAKGSML